MEGTATLPPRSASFRPSPEAPSHAATTGGEAEQPSFEAADLSLLPGRANVPRRAGELLLSEAARDQQEFDLLASVYILREDIRRFGAVRPETWERIYDDELTYVAEGIDAPLVTPLQQRLSGGRLVASNGTPMRQIMENGLTAAERSAAQDPRLAFHVRRARHDLTEFDATEDMMLRGRQGDTILSFSPLPEEALRRYGAALLTGRGYQTSRRTAFARLYHNAGGGVLRTWSISLENSDLGTIRDIAARRGVHIPPETPSDDYAAYLIRCNLGPAEVEGFRGAVIDEYDASLQARTGQPHRQGRPGDDAFNAWDFIRSQRDIVQVYLDQLETLARNGGADRETEESAKRAMTYNFWAFLKQRLTDYRTDAAVTTLLTTPNPAHHGAADGALDAATAGHLLAAMNQAGQAAAVRQDALIGCGGAMTGTAGAAGETDSLYSLSPNAALNAIFSGESGTEDSGQPAASGNFTMRCVNCPLCGRSGVDARVRIWNLGGGARIKRITDITDCGESVYYSMSTGRQLT